MINSERAFNAYAEGAGEINQSLASYRADVDNIKGLNKQLVDSAYQTQDLNTLKDIGGEMGIRTLRSQLGKYWKKKLPFSDKSLDDFDKELGKKIQGTDTYKDLSKRFESAKGDVEDAFQRGRASVGRKFRRFKDSLSRGEGGDETNEIGDEGGGEEDLAGDLRERFNRFTSSGGSRPQQELETKDEEDDFAEGDRDEEGQMNEYGLEDPDDLPVADADDLRNYNDAVPEEPTYEGKTSGVETSEPTANVDEAEEGLGEEDIWGGDGPMSFRKFMRQKDFQTPTTESGDIDFERSDNQLGMIEEDYKSKAMRDHENRLQDERDNMRAEDREYEDRGRERAQMQGEDERSGQMSQEANNEAREQQGMEAEEQPSQEISNQARETEGMQAEEGPSKQLSTEANKEASEGRSMGEEDMSSKQLSDEANQEANERSGMGAEDSDAKDLAKAGEGEAEDLAEGETEGAIEEGIGGVLDATPLAPVGWLLGLIGAGTEAYTTYEAGKGAVDFIEQTLGKKPDVKQVPIPKMGKTQAQLGELIVPTTDTIDTQPSVGGW